MNTIRIEEITDKQVWEEFVLSYEGANFLSSWNWGVFHQKLGKKVHFRGYFQADNLVGVSLVVLEKAKRGNYLTIAGGPLLEWSHKALYAAWVEDSKQLAKKDKALFIRVRPQCLDTPENQKLFSSLGFSEAPMHLTADLTLQLDLTKTSEQILSEMRKNTRYEIRKAEKLNLRVTQSSNPEEIHEFYKHQLSLAKKHDFVPFSLDFLKTQFEVFAGDNQVLLFHSYNNAQLLASAFVILYGDEAVYHYGISTSENAKLPGSYACQWAAIKEAQNRGMKRYNFWGISPKEVSAHHRFGGVSLFKRGFGGDEVSYIPAQDLPVSPLYSIVKAFESARARKRNLT
jgi:lipid II:glycine glycyltransferase (peptidoglycan interpeptide bridge formation enzyme)